MKYLLITIIMITGCVIDSVPINEENKLIGKFCNDGLCYEFKNNGIMYATPIIGIDFNEVYEYTYTLDSIYSDAFKSSDGIPDGFRDEGVIKYYFQTDNELHLIRFKNIFRYYRQ